MISLYGKILHRVSRPAQYLGTETNAVRKEGRHIRIRFALAFPDLYEVGMSHLGLHILYHVLNRKDSIAAERVFAPDLDYAAELEKRGLPLASLESKIPLDRFDAVGFTLQYELSYTNILFMLRLGRIPLLAAERERNAPWILGGGPCAFNPEPLARFFDFFVIGDGEDVIGEIADILSAAKDGGESRRKTLERLAALEGVYVPGFFTPHYHENGAVRAISPKFPEQGSVRKRWVRDLNRVDYPTRPLVPLAPLIHDRLSVEIDRGCTQGCRFCQAGMIYRPVRERSSRKIEELLDSSLSGTGYGEYSLLSLSSGDFSCMNQLVPRLARKYGERRIAQSFPSLRPGTISRELMETIRSVRKTGFTISAEAGTERLRGVINKNITEEDILGTVSDLAGLGWEHFKLYFMIGLPTETEEDVREIHRLCLRILRTAKGKGRHLKSVNMGIGLFVPKAHTPFQWVPQEGRERLREKSRLLWSLFRKRREFTYKRADPRSSLLEAVFARGDRRTGAVLERAFELGCRFDGWGERFRYDLWQRAFDDVGIDPAFYANRSIPLDATLPWSHIHTGISEEFLKEEFHKAVKGDLTGDCRYARCHACGMTAFCNKVLAVKRDGWEGSVRKEEPSVRPGPSPATLRVRFRKTGPMKYLSHLDMNRAIRRACLRAKLPLAYTGGFHPRPRISYAAALPLGTSSHAEYADFQLEGRVAPEAFKDRANSCLPDGLQVTGVRLLPPLAPSLSDSIMRVDYEVCVRCGGTRVFGGRREIEEALAVALESKDIPLKRVRKGKARTINLAPFLKKIAVMDFSGDGLRLSLSLAVTDSRHPQPVDVITRALNLEEVRDLEMEVVKTGTYFRPRLKSRAEA